MRISDWSSDVCSSDLVLLFQGPTLSTFSLISAAAGATSIRLSEHRRTRMSKLKESLEDLRREIDTIDTRLHGLIMQRAALAGRISAAKGEASMASIRPARDRKSTRLNSRH